MTKARVHRGNLAGLFIADQIGEVAVAADEDLFEDHGCPTKTAPGAQSTPALSKRRQDLAALEFGVDLHRHWELVAAVWTSGLLALCGKRYFQPLATDAPEPHEVIFVVSSIGHGDRAVSGVG